MYSLTNLNDQNTHYFENYDQLLARLDELNTICQVEVLEMPLKLIQADHDSGEILDNGQVTLPTERPIDNLLLNFGHKKPKTRRSLPIPDFNKRSKAPKKASNRLSDKQELSEPVSAPDEDVPLVESQPKYVSPVEEEKKVAKPQKRKSKFWQFLALSSCLLSVGFGTLTFYQGKQLADLNKEIKAISTVQSVDDNIDHQLNVFGRYFLTYYFNDKTTDFTPFADSPLAGELSAQKGQLASVILEGVQSTETGYQASFIIAVTKDKATENKRLSLDVIPSETSPYGFVLTNRPQLSNYPTK